MWCGVSDWVKECLLYIYIYHGCDDELLQGLEQVSGNEGNERAVKLTV